MINFSLSQIQDLPRIVEIYNQAIPTRLSTADLEPVTIESKKHGLMPINQKNVRCGS